MLDLVAKPAQESVTPVHFIVWRDIFVVIDDCTAKASVYQALRRILVAQSENYASGLGCLMVVPATATPPSEDMRRAMHAALATASVRCLCWLVEGTGFQGAMVRGVLTSLRVAAHPRFPTHIATNLEQAITWILGHLGGPSRLFQTRAACASIRSQRALGHLVVF